MVRIDRRQFGAMAGCALMAAATPAMSQAQGGPIKIGFGMSLTGALAPAGKSALVASEIWRKKVNDAGGLLGRQVEFVVYDDQSSSALIPSIYTKLLDVDKVNLLLSGYATNQIAPSLPVVMQRKKLLLALHGLTVNDQFKYDRYFHVVPYGASKATWMGGFMDLIDQISPTPKTIGFLYADAEFSQNTIGGIRKSATERNLKVVYDQRFPGSIVDMSSLARGLKAADPEIAVILTYPQQSAAFVRSVSELGLGPNLKMIGGQMVGLQFAPLLESLGPALNGFVTFHFYVPEPTLDSPPTQAFLKTYQDKATSEGVDLLGYYIPTYAYARLEVLQKAIESTKSIDDAELASFISKSSFDTVVGPVRFGTNGERDQARTLFVQFQGVQGTGLDQFKAAGRQVIVGPSPLASGKLRYPFSAART